MPLFRALTPEQRLAVADQAELVTVTAGSWLFRQGDDADGLYVVRSGRLEVVDETPGRPPAVVRELRAGAALGELALVCESQRTSSVRVRRDASLLRIGAADFERLAAESQAFSRQLLRTVGTWLSTGNGGGSRRRATPTMIAVLAADEQATAARLDLALATRLAELTSVWYLTPAGLPRGAPPGPRWRKSWISSSGTISTSSCRPACWAPKASGARLRAAGRSGAARRRRRLARRAGGKPP